MFRITTQHEDSLALADRIRSFRERHPTDADRLLAEYCELIHPTERINALEAKIDHLLDELHTVNRYNDDLQEKLDAAEDRIEELENTKEEENE